MNLGRHFHWRTFCKLWESHALLFAYDIPISPVFDFPKVRHMARHVLSS